MNKIDFNQAVIETGGQPTFWEKFDRLRVTMAKDIPYPDPVISIDGHTISTAGNLTMLSGHSKAGKTAFCSVILAGAIRGHSYCYTGFDPLWVDGNENKKTVIHIDTEQAFHNHYRNVKQAVLSRIGAKEIPEYYYSYNIREMELRDRKMFVTELFKKASDKHNGIHLAVIDGLAEFVKSVNDEIESNEIVSFIEKLSIQYNCPIIAIVHLNPDSNKERGHLGSQLQRKAESVLQIKKDGNLSYCEPYLLRNASSLDIPIIQFEYDKENKCHIYAGIRNRSDEQTDKARLLKDIAKEVFYKEPINYQEAVKRISKLTGKSDRTSKRYIKEMTDPFNFIKKVELPDKPKKEKYYVSLLQ